MTRVVLGVGPVLVSTVVPFWVDIHIRHNTLSGDYWIVKSLGRFRPCQVARGWRWLAIPRSVGTSRSLMKRLRNNRRAKRYK